MRRRVSLVLLGVAVAWLLFDAPVPVWREIWFVLVMLILTIATRSVSWSVAASGVAMGIGVAAPAMIAIGWLLARAGVDVSAGGPSSWALVPVVEEFLKIGVVALVAWLHRRRTRLSFNPSDWLLAGCAVGAGFAMVENAELVIHDPGVLADMARQYGPSWLVPGAWGVTGFVGHAAATGFAAAGIGLSIAMKRAPGAMTGALRQIALAAPMAWITIEHVLANFRVDTGSRAALALGNGRLTPWLFLALAFVVIARDWVLAQRALAHSRIFRRRAEAVRALAAGSRLPRPAGLRQRLLIAASERRLLNAAAWVSIERLSSKGMSR
jgi:RsiW-degrading membrane proteinase PrsW (M82 family)